MSERLENALKALQEVGWECLTDEERAIIEEQGPQS